MKKVIIGLIILLVFSLMFGCTTYNYVKGDKLQGNWKMEAMGFEQTLYFDGQGVGQMQTGFGAQPFNYEILSDSQLKITNLVTGQVGNVSYQLVNNSILMFNKVPYNRVN